MHDRKAFMPRNLAVTGQELAIAWADGHESYYSFGRLRRGCPCASCRSREAAADGPLRVARGPTAEELAIERLVPVGAYAVQVVWSDGHDTGIHAFEALRRECPCPECRDS